MDTNVNFEIALEYVSEQMEITEASEAILFDDDMDALAQSCVDDGPWDGEEVCFFIVSNTYIVLLLP